MNLNQYLRENEEENGVDPAQSRADLGLYDDEDEEPELVDAAKKVVELLEKIAPTRWQSDFKERGVDITIQALKNLGLLDKVPALVVWAYILDEYMEQ